MPLLHAASRGVVEARGVDGEDWAGTQGGGLLALHDKEHAALTYVEKLTRTPHEIGDADFAGLKRRSRSQRLSTSIC